MNKTLTLLAAGLLAGTVHAKIPAPVLDDAGKLKAAEAAAKTAHGNKVANYQLCKSMDKVAAVYYANAKKEGKTVKPADKAEVCADPGPFVFTPPAPTAAAPAPAAATAAAAPKK